MYKQDMALNEGIIWPKIQPTNQPLHGGSLKYADCILLEVQESPTTKGCSEYDTKLHLIMKLPFWIFVSASHQTGLDTRSMTRRSIIVGFRGGEGRARALLDYAGHRPT